MTLILRQSTNCHISFPVTIGWGLSLTEAMLSGNPILANVTGGMQDQMRFSDSDGVWFTPNDVIPSNNTGAYQNHAPWAIVTGKH